MFPVRPPLCRVNIVSFIFKNTVYLKPIGKRCGGASFIFCLHYAALNTYLTVRRILDSAINKRLLIGNSRMNKD